MAGLDPQSHNLILNTIKALGRDLITPEKSLQWDADEVFPRDVLRTLLGPEIGLHLIFLPEEVGGLGGGARDVYRVSEEMARLDLGLATSLLAIALGSDPLRVGGTAAQQQRWLGRVADEGLIVAYGVTEPEAGSNVAALKTRATPVKQGDRVTAYRLDGIKQFISNGGVADLFTILALAPGGPSFFVVEANTPGLMAGRNEEKHGIRSSNTTQLILDSVEVPADQLIGLQEGRGLNQANEVFGYTRLMVAAFGLGAGVEALARAVAYSKERRQFDKHLCQFKGFTHKLLLPHAVKLEAARAYIEEVAARLDSGEQGLQTEGAIAKLFSSEAGNAAAEAAVQALGGYGYTRDYMVEKIKRDVRITTIYEGTSEIQQSIIFLFRFRQVLRSKGTFYSAQGDQVQALGEEVAGGLVARAARTLDKALLALHRLKISKSQYVHFCLADRITEVEHALAFCGRAAGRGPQHKAACRVFAADMATVLSASLTRLLSASAVEDTVVADLKRDLCLDQLLSARQGSFQDMDLVVKWMLDR